MVTYLGEQGDMKKIDYDNDEDGKLKFAIMEETNGKAMEGVVGSETWISMDTELFNNAGVESDASPTTTYEQIPANGTYTIVCAEGTKGKISIGAKLCCNPNQGYTGYVGYTKNSEASGDVVQIGGFGDTAACDYSAQLTAVDIEVANGDIFRFWTKMSNAGATSVRSKDRLIKQTYKAVNAITLREVV